MRPHQLAHPGPRAHVPGRAGGREALRVYGPDGDQPGGAGRTLPGAARRPEELHDGDGPLLARVSVREGPARRRGDGPASVPARVAPAGDGGLARLLGGPAADALRDPLRQPPARPGGDARGVGRLPRVRADRHGACDHLWQPVRAGNGDPPPERFRCHRRSHPLPLQHSAAVPRVVRRLRVKNLMGVDAGRGRAAHPALRRGAAPRPRARLCGAPPGRHPLLHHQRRLRLHRECSPLIQAGFRPRRVSSAPGT